MAHGTASQFWWWCTIWSDDRNQQKEITSYHIISYDANNPFVYLQKYFRHFHLQFCQTKERRSKKSNAMQVSMKKEKKTVSIIRIITVLPVKLQISACSGFESWMKTKSTKNGGGLRARLKRIQNEWKLNGSVWNQQTGFQVLATSTQRWILFCFVSWHFFLFKKKTKHILFLLFFPGFRNNGFLLNLTLLRLKFAENPTHCRHTMIWVPWIYNEIRPCWNEFWNLVLLSINLLPIDYNNSKKTLFKWTLRVKMKNVKTLIVFVSRWMVSAYDSFAFSFAFAL